MAVRDSPGSKSSLGFLLIYMLLYCLPAAWAAPKSVQDTTGVKMEENGTLHVDEDD